MNTYKVYCTQTQLNPDIHSTEPSVGTPFKTIVSAVCRQEAEKNFKNSVLTDKLCFCTENGFLAIDPLQRKAVEYKNIKIYPHPYQCYKIWKSVCKVSWHDLKKNRYRMLVVLDKKIKFYREILESFDTYNEAKIYFDCLPIEEKSFQGQHPLKQIEFTVYEFNEIKEDENGLTCDRITNTKSDTYTTLYT